MEKNILSPGCLILIYNKDDSLPPIPLFRLTRYSKESYEIKAYPNTCKLAASTKRSEIHIVIHSSLRLMYISIYKQRRIRTPWKCYSDFQCCPQDVSSWYNCTRELARALLLLSLFQNQLVQRQRCFHQIVNRSYHRFSPLMIARIYKRRRASCAPWIVEDESSCLQGHRL